MSGIRSHYANCNACLEGVFSVPTITMTDSTMCTRFVAVRSRVLFRS